MSTISPDTRAMRRHTAAALAVLTLLPLAACAGGATTSDETAYTIDQALAGDEVIVNTQAGAASLEFAEAPSMLQATTEVGAVELRVPGDAAYAVTADAQVGKAKVSVRNDPASAHRIQVKTQVGAVTIEPLS